MLRDSIKDQFTDFTLPLKQKNKFNCVRLHLTTTTKTEAEPGKIKEYDHSAAIMKLMENLTFPFMITNGIISAYVLKMEI